ncbi:hypothetical protein PUW24_20550 [Paenibacillus urinalis]|uniref:Uncharacterized protein n=1 Tax=Paenibacillus urinalis TaxID=521520 RepID=A0AAX3MSJ1_9BACL|nr:MULTISPECIES: hypothetical protein [Paenibacillus]WDH80495.1 hypothetical protein PUW23_13045 [Paenibacillus urinalis]WDH96536.1 hypothetical protein PUW24_20550 [Paenibacillus urinalis]WDI00182.1 hypothetical protein PUW25_12715 [Paenibacillus urinalis]
MEKANDRIRNNACSYVDCYIGDASFILQSGKAIGVRIKVQIVEPGSNAWDKIWDSFMPTAYAAELPPSYIGKNSFGYIEHYYHSNDHACRSCTCNRQ